MNTNTKISAGKKYSLQEVAKLNLIPGVSTYQVVYSLVTESGPREVLDKDSNKMVKRDGHVLCTETTSRKIKPINTGRPGKAISGKLVIEGSEIIKFLKLNNLK